MYQVLKSWCRNFSIYLILCNINGNFLWCFLHCLTVLDLFFLSKGGRHSTKAVCWNRFWKCDQQKVLQHKASFSIHDFLILLFWYVWISKLICCMTLKSRLDKALDWSKDTLLLKVGEGGMRPLGWGELWHQLVTAACSSNCRRLHVLQNILKPIFLTVNLLACHAAVSLPCSVS